MAEGFEGQTTFADDPDECTWELELSAEQMLELSKALPEKQATPPPVDSEPSSVSTAPRAAQPALQRGLVKGFGLWPLLLATVAGITATVAWWGLAADRHLPAPTPFSQAPFKEPEPTAEAMQIIPAPSPPAQPQGARVRLRNPFDSTEVFDFPAGTSKADAQKKMAELLMQRALERRHGETAVPAAVIRPSASTPAGVSDR
ncbi:MAG: hypothetical protein JOZ89_01950 [Gammaproteobacteria bacterium]|nr:hypothetical protein [Gammaproteobacteria bacterium]